MTGGEITIGGRIFTHTKTRDYTPISIYKGGDSFLRIGPRDLIVPELNLHKTLLEFGFPIPRIISEGETDGRYYYIETSAGKDLLGELFREDCQKSGAISNENFRKFLLITEKFARAQLKTVKNENSLEGFYYGVHFDYILEELPHLTEKVLAAAEKLKKRLKALPTVLTHGDFNPHNILEGGVIDFGNSFEGPAGYDLVSNIYHVYLFPRGGDFESTRKYEFFAAQRNAYFSLIDGIYLQNNFPKPSGFASDFILGRTIWSAVRMQKYPKIQAWRYHKFEKTLEAYLAGRNIKFA